MKNEILLTVFIVTYNRSKYLSSCINGVLTQSYRDFELFILDNASTDNTQDIVKSFTDERIHYIKHNTNIGGCNNINYAINMCKTKYFIVFHDDDIMNYNLLETEMRELEENEEYSIVSSLCTYMDGEGRPLIINETKQSNRISLFKGYEYLQNFLLMRKGIVCPSVMFRTSFIKEKELFFSAVVGPAGDQYFWFEVEKNGGYICRINEELIRYRIHESQDSQIYHGIMEIDLLIAVIKNIVDENNVKQLYPLIEKLSIIVSRTISRRLVEKKIQKNLYCEQMDKLIGIVCKSRKSILILKCTKMISTKTPFIFSLSYYILNLLRNIRR